MQYKIEGSIADALRVDMNALKDLAGQVASKSEETSTLALAVSKGMSDLEERYSTSFSLLESAASAPTPAASVNRPPSTGKFSAEMDEELECNVFSRRSPNTKIDMLVYHYTTGGTPEGIVEWWNKSRAGSAHYIITKDGKIYGCVPEAKKAWHAGDVNTQSIGIEFCAKIGEQLTEEQTEAGVRLSKDLVARYPINRITGHRFLGQATSCPGSLWRDAGALDRWVINHGILGSNHAAS